MNTFLLAIALATQLIFLAGEIPASGYLYKFGISPEIFGHPWFWAFTVTRFLGAAGQIYLWSSTELGRIAAVMGSCGLILSNILGMYLLHQKPLSTNGYIGLGFAVIAIAMLASEK
jgi:drug/metabolite transporter (DMT)-like permease